MNLLDIITVIFFTVGVVVTGLSFSNRGKNMHSFFAAGGAVPWQMNGLSLYMGFFSAGTFVVWGSLAYSLGWVAVTIQWTMAVAGLLVGSYIAPRWHKTGALTVAEYINKRLGVKTQKVYTYLFLFISLFLTASFLYPVAKIVEVSTGLDLYLSIILLGAFCILYVSAGGLWAVVSTDILQFVILIAAIVIVIPLSINSINGLDTLFADAPSGFFDFTSGEYTIGFVIAFGFYNAIFLAGNWAYVQRFTSVKSARDSQKVGWLFGSLYILSPVLWMLPPMIYRTIDPSLSTMEAEGAYLLMCKQVLPSGLLGLMVGGMIFATTSAMNSKLNIASGVLTNDIFRRIYPKSSDKKLMRVARLSTVGFGVITVIIALFIPGMGGVVNVVVSLAALTGVPLYLPVIWSLFSKRQTGFSVLSTTLISLLMNGLFKFVTPTLGFAFDKEQEMIFGVLFPVLCIASFELYYRYKNSTSRLFPSYKIWERHNNENKTEPTPEQVIEVKNENRYSVKVVGIGIAATGIAIALLGLLASAGQLVVVSTGGVLASIGLLMVRKSIKSK